MPCDHRIATADSRHCGYLQCLLQSVTNKTFECTVDTVLSSAHSRNMSAYAHSALVNFEVFTCDVLCGWLTAVKTLVRRTSGVNYHSRAHWFFSRNLESEGAVRLVL